MVESAIRVLKEKGLVLIKAGQQSTCLGEVQNKEKLDLLLNFLGGHVDMPAIWIEDISRLYDYVWQIPELAWDIVEFAEKPLEVIFDKGKNVSDHLLGENGSIKLRLVKEKELQSLVRLSGKGLFAFTFSSDLANQEEMKKMIGCELVLEKIDSNAVAKPRVIKLGMDGEISFIRK
jgi:L-threonylcarbamoyladenylate synthase